MSLSGAGVTSQNQWHYPATITNSTLAKEIAQFDAGGDFSEPSTAAVINDFGNRQQMVWFTSWGTDWSATSTFLQHAHIHWITRGLRKFNSTSCTSSDISHSSWSAPHLL
jgi:hypothetical protein